MIEIKNLSKSYGKLLAVDNLNLEIKDNECFALLGLNGAGKSTTINILCNLKLKDKGEVYINGLDIDKEPLKIKEIVNVSPQETAVAMNLTVYENLKFIADLYGITDCEEAISEMVQKLNLESKLKAKAKTLSGGQKRRLSIAMALITKPQVLFLDEPTLGLDIKARKALWKIIEEYKNKTTIILTTHYLEEAEMLADRIGIMNQGKLVSLGTVNEILAETHTKDFNEAFLSLAGGEEDD